MSALTIKFKGKHTFNPNNVKVKEQFYTICSNIESKTIKNNPILLMVTSLTQTKSIVHVTAFLALIFSEQGKRVLIVDGNLREPSLHNLFRIDNSPGLTTLLSEERAQNNDHTIKITDCLYCLPTGDILDEPVMLLSSEILPSLIEDWKKHFDLILFHTSNSLNKPDSQIMAKHCDSIVLAIMKGRDKLDKIKSFKKQFERAKYEITGTVIIQ